MRVWLNVYNLDTSDLNSRLIGSELPCPYASLHSSKRGAVLAGGQERSRGNALLTTRVFELPRGDGEENDGGDGPGTVVEVSLGNDEGAAAWRGRRIFANVYDEPIGGWGNRAFSGIPASLHASKAGALRESATRALANYRLTGRVEFVLD